MGSLATSTTGGPPYGIREGHPRLLKVASLGLGGGDRCQGP